MSNTSTPSQQNTALEQATLSVVQQFNSAGINVHEQELPDALNSGRRGHCPGVKLSATHKNGATCTLEIKHLNDFDGGLRATLTFPVEGTGASSVITIRKEDPSQRDFRERLSALVNHAITALGVFGKEDSLTELKLP
jgi:hypothetical protein